MSPGACAIATGRSQNPGPEFSMSGLPNKNLKEHYRQENRGRPGKDTR
jgi:hypothetical protein